MDSPRLTSISRKNLGTPTPSMNKRHGSRSLAADQPRAIRSKTPQPPGPRSKPKKSRSKHKPSPRSGQKSPRRLLQYRARKDSEPQKEIEEELPDYIKATTPQPHSFGMKGKSKKRKSGNKNHKNNDLMMPPINLQRSKSNDRSPRDNQIPEIPQFKPNIPNPNQPDLNRDTSMFTFVKSQFEPDMGFNNRPRMDSGSSSSQYSNYSNYSAPAHHNGYQQYTNQQMPQIPIIMATPNNTTPIPLVHNQLPPHQDDHNFNAQKIHHIPKPPPPKRMSVQSHPPKRKASDSRSRQNSDNYRSRADSNGSTGAQTLLSPKEIEDGVGAILSHYEQAGSRKNSATSTFVANLSGNGNNNNRKSSESYSQSHLRKQTPFKSGSNSQENSPKESPRHTSDWKAKMGFGKKKKLKKGKKDKDSPRKRGSRSKSHKSPFNDEDKSDEEKDDKDHIFKNKLHPANRSGPHLSPQPKKSTQTFQPLAPPKSSPSPYNQHKEIPPQILPNPNPVQSLHPIHPPRSFVMPLNSTPNKPKMRPSMGNRSYSDKNVVSIAPNPYPLNDINSSLHQHIKTTPVPRPRSSANTGNRPKSRTVGDYEDQNYVSDDFMDDREVAHKAVAYDRSLRKQRPPNTRGGNSDDDDVDFGNNEQYQRMMDKMRFRCDQLDWNLNSLQTTTDKDIRQITAKMHRVEHDMKTQNELFNRSHMHRKNGHGRRNSIFNSLESSITAVMRNVDSIKDALQTLDLRMSIINQRQHDIFKHIDETKEILENSASQPMNLELDRSKSGGNGDGTPKLVLNALDKESLINSRRASLQSMSEMLRLQSTRSMSRQEEIDENNNIIQFNNNGNNPLILPTYDDNEDILHNESPTKKKLMGHIRPELLLQAQKSVNGPSGRTTILPNPKPGNDQFVIQKDKSHDITLSMVSSTASGSGDFGVVIERTVTTPIYGIGPQLQGLHGIQNDILSLRSTHSTQSNISDILSLQSNNSKDSNNTLTTPKNLMQLHSIEEKDDDSTESELSLERNTAPISVPPMGSDNEEHETPRQTSFSRRKGHHKQSSRRGSKSKHSRGSINSGLSEHVADQIRSETMLIHSDSEENKKFVSQLQQEDDEKAMEYGSKTPGGGDIDEEKQYSLNKENRRKNKRNKSHHKRSLNHSIDDETTLTNMDMKTLEMPIPGTMEKPKVSDSRKYSESYSININQQHNKNTTTHGGTLLKSRITPRQKEPSIFDAIGIGGGNRDRVRAGSMSYDAIETNIKYEREVSRSDVNSGLMNDLDPLSFGRNQQVMDKNRNQSVQAPLLAAVTDSDNENDDDEESSMSALSEEQDNGTFIIHGDTLKEALDKEKLKEQQKQFEEEQSMSKNSKRSDQSTPKRRKSRKKQMIQLMNCDFVLEKVPNEFTIINNFIIRELTSKPSYLLNICNNTTSHDLFFKTCNIFQSRSKKLRFFKECDISNMNENKNDDDIIIIDENQDSDDHLAPMEDMTFGDICIKKGVHYCGYFVFEAYPFITNTTNNSDGGGGRSRQASTVITPHNKNPITPQLKMHATLGAIDEKKRNVQQTFNQLTELNLNSMDPSTVNKYRRQSISSNASSRRTSLQFLSPKKGLTLSDRVNVHSNSTNYGHNHQNNTYEPSVTSLLGRALDEEQNGMNDVGLPWNDELDDLVDIIVGYDVVLSVGDAELNSFKFFIQFNDYQQPLFYQNKLYDLNALKSFCNVGGDGLQCRGGMNNSILLKCNVNDKDSTHPQIQFNVGYTQKADLHDSSQDELSQLSRNTNTNTTNPETFDID